MRDCSDQKSLYCSRAQVKKAYQELISNLQQMDDIDFDEDLGAVGDVLAKSLAEQYDPEQYFKLVKDQQSKIIYSGEALQEEYFKQFGT